MVNQNSASICSRCGDQSMEHLKTYSHCFCCLNVHDPVTEKAIPDWAKDEYSKISKQFDIQFSRLNGGRKS